MIIHLNKEPYEIDFNIDLRTLAIGQTIAIDTRVPCRMIGDSEFSNIPLGKYKIADIVHHIKYATGLKPKYVGELNIFLEEITPEQ